MSRHLDDIPVYEQTETAVAAALFNRVQIALNRLGEPLEVPLIGLRSLELVLDREAWVVIDRDLNDIPVLAWTDFQCTSRVALHEPVRCWLKTYHLHAPVIVQRVANFMELELAMLIAERQKACEIENVIPWKKE